MNTTAVVGWGLRKRKASIYTKRARVFYIHVQLFFRLKHFNFTTFIVIVTMMRNCI